MTFPYPGDDPNALATASSDIDAAKTNMSTYGTMLTEVKGQLGSAWTGEVASKAQGDLGKVQAMIPTVTSKLAAAKSAIDALRTGLIPIRNEIDTLRTKYVNLSSTLEGQESAYARAPRLGEANDMTPAEVKTMQAGIATDEGHTRTQLAALVTQYNEEVAKANRLTATCVDALNTAANGSTHYAGSTLTQDSLSTALGMGGLAVLHAKKLEDLATKYADELKKSNSGDGKEAALYHKIALEAGPYMNDPDFAATFIGDLGPQQTQLIPTILDSIGSQTAGSDLKFYSGLLGTAISNDDHDPRVKAVETMFLTKPPEAALSWARAAMCSAGTFPATLLAQAARVKALDDFAKNGQSGFDGMGFRGEPNDMTFRQSVDLPEDVVALWTGDLSHNPEAARDAVATMGSDSPDVNVNDIDPQTLTNDYSTNIHKLISYGAGDQVDGMGKAAGDLFVAASGANEPDGSHSYDASNFARGLFNDFGQNPHDGDNVPPTAAADYAKIGGSYVQEMAAGSNMDGSSVSDVTNQLTGQNAAFGVPPDVAKNMMRSFVGDPTATHDFDNAAGAQYHAAQLAAAKLDAGLPASQAENLNNTTMAYGSVAGAENATTHDVLGERDEQAESDNEVVKGVLSAGLDLIPGEKLAENVPGTVWDVAKHLGNMGLESAYGTTDDPRFDALQNTSHALSLSGAYNNLSVLQEAGYPGANTIPHDLIDPSTGQMYPVGKVLADPNLQQSFHDYMQVGGAATSPAGTARRSTTWPPTRAATTTTGSTGRTAAESGRPPQRLQRPR